MQAQVVVICGFIEEGFFTQMTLILLLLRVNQLVFEQSIGVLKAAMTGLTAEGSHVHSAPVPPHDHSALACSAVCSSPAPHAFCIDLLMNLFLVSLQLEVVEESPPTKVTHERLGCSVDEHVGL